MYHQFTAIDEERNTTENDKSLKGKTRAETDLKEFKGTKIISTVMGVIITITQENIAHLIGIENVGIVKCNSKDGTKLAFYIKANIF